MRRTGHIWRRYLGSGLLVLALAGCAVGTTSSRYNAWRTPADHVDQLLAAGHVEEADQVFGRQQAFFHRDAAMLEDTTEKLDAALARYASTDFNTARQKLATAVWPVPYERWDEVEDALDMAREVIAKYGTFHVASRAGKCQDALAQITRSSAALRRKVKASAAQAFAVYPLFSAPNFFGAYPVKLKAEDFFADHRDLWIARVRDADTAELGYLYDYYRKLLPEDLKAGLARRYYEAEVAGRSGGRTPGFPALLKAAEAVRKRGISLGEVAESRIALIDITSFDGHRGGAFDFPTTIDADLPLQMEQAEAALAFDSPLARTADVLVLVNVVKASTEQEVGEYETVESEYLAGTSVEPNPAYLAAQADAEAAAFKLRQAKLDAAVSELTSTGTWLDILAFGANLYGQTKAEGEFKAAMAVLRSESPTIERPIYEPYSFHTVRIETVKEATVRYYVIDRLSNRYVRDIFTAREERSFTVVYDIAERDRDRAAHLAGTSSEAEVSAFQQRPIRIALSKILGHLDAAGGKSRPLPALAEIRRQVLADRDTALAVAKSRSYDAVPLNEDRFDSVVIVYHAGGAGSGFFVREDLVLTNFHVVEGTSYPKVRTYGGEEVSARVIAQDARLDLALLELPIRGKPVTFYTARSLPLGATVETIGHPEGFQFTLTRGIISAVRKLQSDRVPGGKLVRYVQTDAAVNHGNSGGPLFLGDKVIGVNTWGLRKDIAENLNFAVHYGEVLDFLKDHAVSRRPGS